MNVSDVSVTFSGDEFHAVVFALIDRLTSEREQQARFLDCVVQHGDEDGRFASVAEICGRKADLIESAIGKFGDWAVELLLIRTEPDWRFPVNPAGGGQ